MTIQHEYLLTWQNGNNQLPARKVVEGESEINITVSVPDSETDFEITLPLTVAAIKSLVIVSTQAVTIKSHTDSTLNNTWTFAANSPLWWMDSMPTDNPLAAQDDGDPVTAITKLLITNNSGSAATIQVRALVDATP